MAEADESDRSFLYLRPQAAVVTNVEFDHPDFYSSLDDVVETFRQFVRSLPEDGHLVTCADDPSLLAGGRRGSVPRDHLRHRLRGPQGRDPCARTATCFSRTARGAARSNSASTAATTSSTPWPRPGVARWLGHDAFEAASTLRTFGGRAPPLPAQGGAGRDTRRRRLRPPPDGALGHARRRPVHHASGGTGRSPSSSRTVTRAPAPSTGSSATPSPRPTPSS